MKEHKEMERSCLGYFLKMFCEQIITTNLQSYAVEQTIVLFHHKAVINF